MGRPWWKNKVLAYDEQGRLIAKVGRRGYMEREAKRELGADATGAKREGKGIVGYRSRK